MSLTVFLPYYLFIFVCVYFDVSLFVWYLPIFLHPYVYNSQCFSSSIIFVFVIKFSFLTLCYFVQPLLTVVSKHQPWISRFFTHVLKFITTNGSIVFQSNILFNVLITFPEVETGGKCWSIICRICFQKILHHTQWLSTELLNCRATQV